MLFQRFVQSSRGSRRKAKKKFKIFNFFLHFVTIAISAQTI